MKTGPVVVGGGGGGGVMMGGGGATAIELSPSGCSALRHALEAIALGLPMIGTLPIPGTPERFKNGLIWKLQRAWYS